jgi:hypothetical protein
MRRKAGIHRAVRENPTMDPRSRSPMARLAEVAIERLALGRYAALSTLSAAPSAATTRTKIP